MRSVPTSKTRQCGVALIFSLIMLLLVTILSVTAMQDTVMQEKMAGNLRDRELAFQGAEVTLRDGETWLQSLTQEPEYASADDFIGKVWLPEEVQALAKTDTWWADGAAVDMFAYGENVGGVPGLAQAPKRVVERLAFVRDGGSITIGQPQDLSGVVVYRITGRSVGGSQTAVVILQSTYGKRY